ncbi:MAG TPA: S8 family serine peptidase [Chthoniobacteraceae bacterium]|jgi:hypothetical protein|nr:S8 family serine peptidase [Chthoniobacteraceae bacterium]
MKRLLLTCALCGFAWIARGQSTLDTIGVTALNSADPTLTGSGVNVVQIESSPDPLQYEVNPADVSQPDKLFTYRSTAGSSGTFPNRSGSESNHADSVAQNFYALYGSVSPGVRHVSNYETSLFYRSVIVGELDTTARVFNQSFEFGNHNAAQDEKYDNYIARYHPVVASGIGDGGSVLTPADCYNGLGVGAYGGSTSTGPAAGGRSKPDITAPASATSYSTPLVSGAAALLIQEGLRLKTNANAATDSRTVKALLLTGAAKPSGWSHTSTAPLDPNYGAGVLNVYNSYEELMGGRYSPGTNGINASRGWSYGIITSKAKAAGTADYTISTGSSGALIATLVWNKGYGAAGINQISLFVFDSGGNQLAESVSTVDNVQHIYLTGLSGGTYRIEVQKAAGRIGSAAVAAASCTYALAWDFGR